MRPKIIVVLAESYNSLGGFKNLKIFLTYRTVHLVKVERSRCFESRKWWQTSLCERIFTSRNESSKTNKNCCKMICYFLATLISLVINETDFRLVVRNMLSFYFFIVPECRKLPGAAWCNNSSGVESSVHLSVCVLGAFCGHDILWAWYSVGMIFCGHDIMWALLSYIEWEPSLVLDVCRWCLWCFMV